MDTETRPPLIEGIQPVSSGTGWFTDNWAPVKQCPHCGDIHVLNDGECGKG